MSGRKGNENKRNEPAGMGWIGALQPVFDCGPLIHLAVRSEHWVPHHVQCDRADCPVYKTEGEDASGSWRGSLYDNPYPRLRYPTCMTPAELDKTSLSLQRRLHETRTRSATADQITTKQPKPVSKSYASFDLRTFQPLVTRTSPVLQLRMRRFAAQANRRSRCAQPRRSARMSI